MHTVSWLTAEHVNTFFNRLDNLVSVNALLVSAAGEHEDEGAYGKGAQSKAPPPGIPQPPKGRATPSVSHTREKIPELE